MKSIANILFISTVLLLAGCVANRVEVTYYSDPPWATLYDGQRPVGYTPFTLIYNISPEEKNKRYLKLQGPRVVLASGVSTSIDSLTLDRGTGSGFHFTFSRQDAPGRELDANFALQLERNRILQQQA